MKNGFRVIDADAHHIEPLDIWDKFVKVEFKHRVPRVTRAVGALFEYAPSEVFPTGDQVISRLAVRPNVEKELEGRFGEAYRRWWNMESRLKDMDRMGVDVQVCFPTNGAAFQMTNSVEPKMAALLARAYNDWAADYSRPAKDRVKLAATLNAHDTKEAVKEARRAVEDLDAVTVVIRSEPIMDRLWHDPAYDPLWQLAEDLDFPISFHTSGSSHLPHAGDRFRGKPGLLGHLDHAAVFPMENMLAMGNLIFGGVFDNFPRLRVSFLESNAGWVPFWIGRMEDHVVGRAKAIPMPGESFIRKSPSDYFKRQCFVACDADEEALKGVIEHVGDDNIIFNTDYPHTDSLFPEPVDIFLKQPIPEASKKKILWDNAVKLYGPRLLESR